MCTNQIKNIAAEAAVFASWLRRAKPPQPYLDHSEIPAGSSSQPYLDLSRPWDDCFVITGPPGNLHTGRPSEQSMKFLIVLFAAMFALNTLPVSAAETTTPAAPAAAQSADQGAVKSKAKKKEARKARKAVRKKKKADKKAASKKSDGKKAKKKKSGKKTKKKKTEAPAKN